MTPTFDTWISTAMAALDVTGVSNAEMPRLDAVPYDIKLAIVWDGELAWDDVAALRLTSRALVEAASTRLFHTVAVSKLRRDRDSFLTICQTPRLARHIREIEWLELSWDAGFVERLRVSFESEFALPGDEEKGEDGEGIGTSTDTLFRDIEAAAKAAFWLFNDVFGSDANEAARQAAVEDFLPEFQAAIDNLPNLHTFVSRPMPPLRSILPSGANQGYPLSAGTLQAHHDKCNPPTVPQTNDGLLVFLAPTMARPTSTITQLRWVDERPGFSYTRTIPASALAHLTSLDLRFVVSSSLKPSAFTALEAACAAAAPTLQHLGLSIVDHPGSRGTLHEDDLLLTDPVEAMYDGFWSDESDDDDDPFALAKAPCETDALGCMLLGPALGTAAGCNLVSLRLVGVRLVVEMVDVLRANAATLRHLHLEAVGATLGVVQHLARVQGFALETVCIIEDYPGYRIAPHDLLEILNKEVAPDEDSVPRLTYDHMRQWRQKLFQLVTSTGASFDDREINDPDDCRACVWPHRPRHVLEEGDACLELDPEPAMDEEDAPRWRWGWYVPPGQGQKEEEEDVKSEPRVYYCPVPANEESSPCNLFGEGGDENGSRPTEAWRFTSRANTVVYGRDPLTWFDEWDTEEEEGDVAEPTPFCHALVEFVRRGPPERTQSDRTTGGSSKSEGHGDWDGDTTWDGWWNRLPEGAVVYDPLEDPLANAELAYEEGE